MYTTVPSAGKKMAKQYLLQLKNVEEEVSSTHKRRQKKKYETCLPTFVKEYDLPELYWYQLHDQMKSSLDQALTVVQ